MRRRRTTGRSRGGCRIGASLGRPSSSFPGRGGGSGLPIVRPLMAGRPKYVRTERAEVPCRGWNADGRPRSSVVSRGPIFRPIRGHIAPFAPAVDFHPKSSSRRDLPLGSGPGWGRAVHDPLRPFDERSARQPCNKRYRFGSENPWVLQNARFGDPSTSILTSLPSA